MSRYLLTHGYIVTVDQTRRVFADGWVSIEGDSIIGVGDMRDVPNADGAEIVDLHGMLVLPGFVNGHNHHWGSLFKNTGEGLLLEPWLHQVALPLGRELSDDDLRIAAYLGAIEQVRTGTTCSLNHVVLSNDHETMRATIEPVIEVGVRQLVSKELRGTPVPPFSSHHPVPTHPRALGEELALAREIVERWDGWQGRIHMGLAIETSATWMLNNNTSDEVITAGVTYARERGLKITNHCSASTPWLSIREFRETTGGGDIDYLMRLGALADNWVFIHSVHLSPREIRFVADVGASVITSPVSNAYCCVGIAPLRQMLDAGVNVGLGSDGAYVNCSPDMVEQMKFAILIQNVTHMDPTFMSAERAIEMATINAARAMGLDHLIGSLETGKKADIAIFNLDNAHTTVANNPVAALVYSANGTDVDTVFVDGRRILREGNLTTINADQERLILEEARARAAEVIARAGLTEKMPTPWGRSWPDQQRADHP
jgi:5-methylthioadenosine/S-adenosylhomocysteine deaminase